MNTRKNNTKTNKHSKTKKRVFKQKDYISGDGMVTKIWGPPLWHSLHTISFNYPINPTNQDKKNYSKFILNLQNVLPCKYCRINLKTNLKNLPLTINCMKNRESFSKYIYNLHELVNKMLKKKSNLTYCDVRERFEHFRSRCTLDKPIIFKLNKSTDEKGCTEPLYGKKSKCVIKIIPEEEKTPTFQIDEKCIKKNI